MRHFILSVLVMMITSTTTFSQHIGKAYIGLSLDGTIEQCEKVGYELIIKDEKFAKFLIPNNNETYDLDIRLIMYASPVTKTVWFGVMTFNTENRKEKKQTFLSMVRVMTDKYGTPYKKRRKTVKWDTGHSFVYIENTKTGVKYTVISPGAFNRIESEY